MYKEYPPLNLIKDDRISRDSIRNHIVPVPSYQNSEQITLVNVLNRLLLSISYWPKVILLNGDN